MNVDELIDSYSLSNVQNVININEETREIEIEENFLAGVESDEKVERIYFTCPKIVGDNVNLTQFNIYVNYKNANGEEGSYLVEDVTADESGSNINFTWLLSRTATKYKGYTNFIICAKKSLLNGDLTNEWNTTVAKIRVLEGLEVTNVIEEQNADVIEQILLRLVAIEQNAGIGTIDYSNISNKPKINDVELSGNKTSDDLDIQSKDFIVNFTIDSSFNISVDKTFDDIKQAYDDGRTIVPLVVEYQQTTDIMANLLFVNSNSIVFYLINYYANLPLNDTTSLNIVNISKDNTINLRLTSLFNDESNYDTLYTSEKTILGSINEIYNSTLKTLEKPTVITLKFNSQSNTWTCPKTSQEIYRMHFETPNIALSMEYNPQKLNNYYFIKDCYDNYSTFYKAINDKYNWVEGIEIRGSEITFLKYEIPIADSETVGGVMPVAKTEDMTQEVGIDENGRLFTAKSSGGGDLNVDEELREYLTTTKQNIKEAIINKGGNVETTDSFNDYATRITEIPNGISPAQTIPNQTTLIANGLQDTLGIELKWTNVNASGYVIVRKENVSPISSADGDIIYNGAYTTDFVDTDVSYGKNYYYRIFPRNSLNQYQSIEQGSIANVNYISRTGQFLIRDLSLGDTIKFGQYGTTLYTWKIVDTLDKDKGYVTVCSNNYPGSWQFDASENSSTNPNPDNTRKNTGNNRWAYSNIRQILNSSGEGGTWYVAQHEYDVQPSYVNSNGFLKDFTTYEKNVIVNKTNKCNLPTYDGGGSETVVDKIWLASVYAMGLALFQPLEDDHIYEYFVDNASRSFTSSYWLRSINDVSNTTTVRYVYAGGTVGYLNANVNGVAPRPFCLLPTSAYVTWSESDSAYIFVDDEDRNPK